MPGGVGGEGPGSPVLPYPDLARGVSLPECAHPMCADPAPWYCQLELAPSNTDERHWYYGGPQSSKKR